MLGMINSVVIADSPNKPNIKYSVVQNPGTLEETFESLIAEVGMNRQLTERTISFATYMTVVPVYTGGNLVKSINSLAFIR